MRSGPRASPSQCNHHPVARTLTPLRTMPSRLTGLGGPGLGGTGLGVDDVAGGGGRSHRSLLGGAHPHRQPCVLLGQNPCVYIYIYIYIYIHKIRLLLLLLLLLLLIIKYSYYILH